MLLSLSYTQLPPTIHTDTTIRPVTEEKRPQNEEKSAGGIENNIKVAFSSSHPGTAHNELYLAKGMEPIHRIINLSQGARVPNIGHWRASHSNGHWRRHFSSSTSVTRLLLFIRWTTCHHNRKSLPWIVERLVGYTREEKSHSPRWNYEGTTFI